MVFPYRLGRSPQPVVSLGGRTNRPRAIIPLAVIGPSRTRATPGLLDTGSDDTIFPESVAAYIGLDLTTAPSYTFAGAGGPPYTVRFAQVTLRVTDGHEFREWPAWVGFTPARLGLPLLGFAGFLQFFDATFRGQREEVELAANGLYPGV